MVLSHRQERACALAAVAFIVFIGYRATQWKFWIQEVRHEDAYLAGPRNKAEMDFVRKFYAPKTVKPIHHRRHHKKAGP